jgi:uncharacterized protein with von Willebrand factor type A (vWA) domain
MTTKVAPLGREELHRELVTDADAFVVGRYLRQREDAPAIAELEKTGEAKIPGAAAALADTFNALWSDEIGFKPDAEVAPNRRYWRELLGQTATTAAFEELHGRTAGDMLMSFVGTMEAGATLLKFVPAEDQRKLQELADAQKSANSAEQAAQDAAAEADALAQMADAAAQGEGQGQAVSGGNGQPSGNAAGGNPGGMSAEEAHAMADRLSQQWEQAQAKADAARSAADAAKAGVEAKAEALMGQPGSVEAKAKADELRRLGIAVAKKASEKVEEFSKTIQAWGLEPGELEQKPFPEAVNFLERLRRSEAMKKFAALLGRLRAMAARKAKSRTPNGSQKVARRETGRDLTRLARGELVRVALPAMRAGFYRDWSRGTLQLRGTEEKKTLGRGPVIVCEDASGSMDGVKQQWAKGVVLSLAHFAKIQHRSFGWILFDAHVHRAEVYHGGRLGAEAMLKIAEARAGGGTDFERPLRRAFEMIRNEGLRKADVLLVTDGDCAVSTDFLEEVRRFKKEFEVNIVTVICDEGGHCSDATVRSFSDRVERVSAFSAEEAETKVFNNL